MNVENVLKLPRNPIENNKYILFKSFILINLVEIDKNNPKMKDAKLLINKTL
tara:strand:- start:211 stop:366 length:156 start_codon:yes stop_codon:yes gene_type:complete